MKRVVLIVVIVILLVLLYQAWKKETLEHDVEIPESFLKRGSEPEVPQKALKTRMPNTREERCRDIFEEITGKAYPTVRPDFLKNPKTGRNLELDGYCHELKSAFEYQGYQHYKYPNKYHKTREEFFDQLDRDQFKVEACAKAGMHLTVIPYTFTDEEMEDFVRTDLISWLSTH